MTTSAFMPSPSFMSRPSFNGIPPPGRRPAAACRPGANPNDPAFSIPLRPPRGKPRGRRGRTSVNPAIIQRPAAAETDGTPAGHVSMTAPRSALRLRRKGKKGAK